MGLPSHLLTLRRVIQKISLPQIPATTMTWNCKAAKRQPRWIVPPAVRAYFVHMSGTPDIPLTYLKNHPA